MVPEFKLTINMEIVMRLLDFASGRGESEHEWLPNTYQETMACIRADDFLGDDPNAISLVHSPCRSLCTLMSALSSSSILISALSSSQFPEHGSTIHKMSKPRASNSRCRPQSPEHGSIIRTNEQTKSY